MQSEFEQEYYDVLRGIEVAIHAMYKREPQLTDHSVSKAIDGLERLYKARQRNRRTPTLKLSQTERELLVAIQTNCDLHLGLDKQVQPETIRTLEEITACLQRIKRSLSQMEKHGRQAYVQFLDSFFNAHHKG